MIKNFIVNNEKFEVYFCDSGQVEVYNLKDIKHTGFIFDNIKQFNVFVNSITDILEEYNLERE